MKDKEKLQEIRKQITQIGMKLLKEKTPIPVNKASEFLKPFVKIEKNIDKIILNLK